MIHDEQTRPDQHLPPVDVEGDVLHEGFGHLVRGKVPCAPVLFEAKCAVCRHNVLEGGIGVYVDGILHLRPGGSVCERHAVDVDGILHLPHGTFGGSVCQRHAVDVHGL